ncbi:MAG: copper chaperone PCu(A)C [Micropruina sp.]|nr:copper chaperone PCu(A)C [Micropruina sp.]
MRATTGATNASMTGAFMSLVNPGETEIRLVGASTSVAPMVQIHEMVSVDGAMVMQEATGGVAIPVGGHLHLKPGSYHVMLMMLKAPLAVGDQVPLTLRFSDGSQLEVNAPVKAFVEEEDHYHSASPSPSMSPSSTGS